jgi:hypothetical protein
MLGPAPHCTALPCHCPLQKHIDDVPELKAEKQAMNRRTLKAMQVGVWAGLAGSSAGSRALTCHVVVAWGG